MAKRHHPRRGSQAFSPRKRAKSHIPRFGSWAEIEGEPKVQGFLGYKVGMTHVLMMDERKRSTTSGMEIQTPVTIIETPPMKVAAVRVYGLKNGALYTITEAWASNIDKHVARRLPVPEKYDGKKGLAALEKSRELVEEVRIIAYTQPWLITGVPKKVPDIIELRIGGGTIAQRLDYAKKLLGKEILFSDFAKDGTFVDVASITKGKGFQGHIKRWGVKLQPRKNSKHRRMIGTLGPHFPSYVMPTVPQAGQMGYHQRTELNKLLLKVKLSKETVEKMKGKKAKDEEKPEAKEEEKKETTADMWDNIVPPGGFLHYGVLRSDFVVVKGSVPGPAKRAVAFRDAVRKPGTAVPELKITYISKSPKQGA
ncbi:MAG: 50S ribosomal protein L3 [Thermoplasmata archaeon]|nr:50S ribosomal protein L3 [Thermoplasmata archaeon]